MSEILAPEELEALTGTTRANLQIEVLKQQGVRYLPDRKGRPVVIWDWVRTAGKAPDENSNIPNFEALNRGTKAASQRSTMDAETSLSRQISI